MKYYFFLDETGDHGLSFVDPNFPIFLLAGCIFEENSLRKTESSLIKFKNDFFNTNDVILHSRDIRKCNPPFEILFDLDLKQKFYEQLNKIISESNFTMIAAGVHKARHIKKYGKSAGNPYNLSLSFIIERLIFCLDQKEMATVEIFIEKRGRKEDKLLTSVYNSIRDLGTHYVDPNRISQKISSFSFYNKKENILGLQLADLCAYPLARHILQPSIIYQPFSILENKIYCDKTGKYMGYGLKIFP